MSLLSFSKQICVLRQPLFSRFHTGFSTSVFEETDVSKNDTNSQHINEDLMALKSENQKLNENLSQLNDKYMRALAESENTRKRYMRQVEDAKLFGIQSFCKDLLEVSDILHAATESNRLKDNADSDFLNLYEGLKMTETVMAKVFERHNLVKISPEEGERFDPNYHEAVFKAPLSQGKEENTIATVTKIGYKLNERTLRPAFVGVYGQ